MNEMSYLERYALGLLGEEGGELAQACGKALRFGLDVGGTPSDTTARMKIEREAGDVIAAIRYAETRGLIDRDNINHHANRKLARLLDPDAKDGIGRRLAP